MRPRLQGKAAGPRAPGARLRTTDRRSSGILRCVPEDLTRGSGRGPIPRSPPPVRGGEVQRLGDVAVKRHELQAELVVEFLPRSAPNWSGAELIAELLQLLVASTNATAIGEPPSATAGSRSPRSPPSRATRRSSAGTASAAPPRAPRPAPALARWCGSIRGCRRSSS